MIKRPYYVRLLACCILAGMIPVLGLGYFLADQASDRIQTKVDEAHAYILQQKKQQVDQVLHNTERLSTQFLTSAIVYELLPRALMPIDFREIENLKQALGNMISLESSIQDIYFVNYANLWSVSNQGWVRYEDREQMAHLMRYADPLRASGWISPSEAAPVFGSNAVLSVKNMPVNSLQPQGLLIVVLSADSLAKVIEGQGEGDQSAKAMITDARQAPVAGHVFYEDRVRRIEQWKTRPGQYPSERSSFVEDGAEFIVQREASAVNDWQYVMTTSVREATRDAREIAWSAVLLCAAMLLVAVGLAYAGSTSMYRPIHRLVTLFRGDERAWRAHHKVDEVRYIYDRIQSQSSQLAEFFMSKLLQGLVPKKQVAQRLAEHGYQPASWRYLCVSVIQIDSLAGTRFDEKDRDLLLFAIHNIARDIIPRGDCLVPVVIGNRHATVYVGTQSSEEAFQASVNLALRDIHAAVHEVLGVNVSIGVSRVFEDPETIPDACKEGAEALKYRLSLGGHAILHIQDVEAATGSSHNRYPAAEAALFMDALMSMEPTDSIRQRLDEALSEIFLERNSAREQGIYLGQLVSELFGMMQKTDNRLIAELDGAGPFTEALLLLGSRSEVRDRIMTAMVSPALEELLQRRDHQNRAIVDLVVRTVVEEYGSNLTLESCAARLNYHPDYVGRVFRKEMGIGFAEYLSEYRHGIAKQLLKDTETKIAEIARQVGYANPQNFIRHFRKREDMTPGAYREKNI